MMKRIITTCAITASMAQAVANFDHIEQGCCEFYTEADFEGDMQKHCKTFHNYFNEVPIEDSDNIRTI